MSYLAVFKRVVPFIFTFAAGLLIASIFVPVTTPSFPRVEGGRKHCRDHKRKMRFEYENLRQDRDRLREEIEQLRRDAENAEFKNLKLVLPEELEVEAPPPPPSKRPRHPHGQ